jgi:hypothetical protein
VSKSARISRVECIRCHKRWAWFGAHEFVEGELPNCFDYPSCWGRLRPAGWEIVANPTNDDELAALMRPREITTTAEDA